MQNRGRLLRLDFKPQYKGFLSQAQDGPSYVEDKTPHWLEIIVHLILIFMTMGLWLFVWALIALGRRNSKRHVRVSFGDTADGLLVTVSGDEGRVQAVEAYIRREYATAPVPAGP